MGEWYQQLVEDKFHREPSKDAGKRVVPVDRQDLSHLGYRALRKCLIMVRNLHL